MHISLFCFGFSYIFENQLINPVPLGFIGYEGHNQISSLQDYTNYFPTHSNTSAPSILNDMIGYSMPVYPASLEYNQPDQYNSQ